MMDNFSQNPSTATQQQHIYFQQPLWKHHTFKVQVNFDIPIFEGQIDADAIDNWLNMLEGYFSVHDFSSWENITFSILKFASHVKERWETYCEKKDESTSSLF